MSDLGSGDSPPPSNMTSDNLTCAARGIQGSFTPVPTPDSKALVLAMKIYSMHSCVLLHLAGSCLNILLLYLIIGYKKLHTLSFWISLQLVVLDLLHLYITDSFRLVTVFSSKWLLGAGMCAFVGFVDLAARNARSFLMCVFVIDRFLSVFAAYFYPRHNKKIAIILSVLAWVAALLSQVPVIPVLLDCYTFSAPQRQCTYSSSCNPSCAVYGQFYLAFVFFPSTLIPVVLYAVLYWKVKKIKREEIVIGQPESSKKDWKAAITFFLLFLCTFMLTLPAVIVIVIIRALFSSPESSPAFYAILLILSSVSSLPVIADPIVIMRHRDVKEVLREIKTKLCERRGSQQSRRDQSTANSSRVRVRQSVTQEGELEDQL